VTQDWQLPDVIALVLIGILAVYIIALCWISDCTHNDKDSDD
jgi:hypothetical protein